MSNSNLTISLNEILFFFTRAGFGVDAPVGIAEDFARSNIWIAQNGFDPSLCSIKALNNLDNSESSLAINFEKNSTPIAHQPSFCTVLQRRRTGRARLGSQRTIHCTSLRK